MPITFDLVGIAVHDMARSLSFYRTLGLSIPEGQDQEAHVELDLGGIRLAWDTIDMLRGAYGEWVDNPTGQRIELAFACDSAAGVDAAYDRLTDGGARGHREPWDAFWGQRYAIVEDPDGNFVSLFAGLAGA